MENYINTDKGHGVVYQGQPVLNANDHVKEINLTHFGDCKSKLIFEEAKKQADEKYKAEEGDGFFGKLGKGIAKTVTKAVIGTKEIFASNKCELDTPLPWIFTSRDHMIDGAPALTVESQCPCKFGGTISIVLQEEEAAVEAEEFRQAVVVDAPKVVPTSAAEGKSDTDKIGIPAMVAMTAAVTEAKRKEEKKKKDKKGKGKTYVTLEQMKKLGWRKIHCGYTVKSTGKDSPLDDMTSEISRKYRDINQRDVDKINALLEKYQINTKKRIVAFFAECSAETNDGTRFLEAAGTKEIPLVGPATRANLNKWFDKNKDYGSKYRGAGAIQLTWDYHYKEFKKWMNIEFGITDPNITKKGAEHVAMNYTWEAAVFFWSKSNLNSKADTGDIHEVTAVVNRNMTSKEYKKREDAYETWMEKYIFPH